MSMAWVWVAIPICIFLSSVATTWIRAKYGYPIEPRGPHGRRSRGEWHVPAGAPGQVDKLKDALAASESKLAKLEARVRVLEKIVTDTSSRLGEEIERLRD
jgi:hypothetical protein